MRPKKIILLVDSNEQRQSLTRFMICTAGFKVLSYASADSARKCEQYFDLVLAYWPVEWNQLHIIAQRREVRFLLVCPQLTGAPAEVFADAVLVRGEATAAGILEKVKFGVVRKRGPNPGCNRKDFAEVA